MKKLCRKLNFKAKNFEIKTKFNNINYEITLMRNIGQIEDRDYYNIADRILDIISLHEK